MDKKSFSNLFYNALEQAALDAEESLNRRIPRRFEILLHGAGFAGVVFSPEEAIDILYINSDTFYRIIDFSVIAVYGYRTKVFVRASSHEPGSFERTWNTPPGYGPFKQLGPAVNLVVEED